MPSPFARGVGDGRKDVYGEKQGCLVAHQRAAAGQRRRPPPAQQDEMLAQLANPLLHRIRRQKIIRSVLAFIRREGGRTSTRHTKTSQKRGHAFCYREPGLLTCYIAKTIPSVLRHPRSVREG